MMSKALVDLESIRADIAQQLSQIDQALSQIKRVIEPIKPAEADYEPRIGDKWLTYKVVDGIYPGFPHALEVSELDTDKVIGVIELSDFDIDALITDLVSRGSPNDVLALIHVHVNEMESDDIVETIDILVGKIGLSAYLSQRGND